MSDDVASKPRPCRLRLAPVVVISLCGACFSHAFAQSRHEAELFERGAFLEAASSAEGGPGADEQAFAARALLAAAVTGGDPPDPQILERALVDAERAMELQPDHAEGRLQAAIALSLKSRSMSSASAVREGIAGRTRRMAEEVLKMDPSNHYAHAFLAVWHVEVRRRGGALGAALLGASLEEGEERYREAMRLQPRDISVAWQYARALTALDPVRYGAPATNALETALAVSPRDHVEAVLQERARELLRAYRAGPRAAQEMALSRL